MIRDQVFALPGIRQGKYLIRICPDIPGRSIPVSRMCVKRCKRRKEETA